MDSIKDMQALAESMLAGGAFDKDAYGAIERFVLANGSRLGREPQFHALKAAAAEVARKYGIPDIEQLQEGFGANSCAQ